ncbi:hypothetical protein ACLI4Q_18090 [Natrialbaceae archaeon A-CW1-1]
MSTDTFLEELTRHGYDDSLVGVAYLVLTVILVALSGPFGLVAGLVTAATWYALGTPFAIAVGHIALVGLFPDGIGLVSFVLVETAFLAIFLTQARLVPSPVRFGGVALASLLLLGGGVWLGISVHSLWIGAGLFITLLVTGLYVVARYGRISLGLVPDSLESGIEHRSRSGLQPGASTDTEPGGANRTGADSES